MGTLDGMVAVVSGAARGQGRSHALRLAEEGADVVAMDGCADLASVPYPLATPEDLKETVAAVEAHGRRAIAVTADVRDAPAVREGVDAAVAELGRLDIVVANAGVVSYAAATEMTDGMWGEMIDTNLTGAWNLCRATIGHLVDGGRGGAVVITSSTWAHTGIPHLAHYSAAKAGLVGMMQSLAVELGPHSIRVNTIHPTAVRTSMLLNDASYDVLVPDHRERPDSRPEDEARAPLTLMNSMPVPWIEPADISNAVLFLVSDQGRYVTGTQLRVDAGCAVH